MASWAVHEHSGDDPLFSGRRRQKRRVTWTFDASVRDSFTSALPEENPADESAEIADRDTNFVDWDLDDEVVVADASFLDGEVIDTDVFSAGKSMRALASCGSDMEQHQVQLELIKEYGLIPIMEEDSRIEYYSSANATWMLGKLQVKVVDQLRLYYQVTLPRVNQTRQDVLLDGFRSPFTRAEPIDVFFQHNQGVWIPGFIDGKPRSGATTIGYRISLESNGGVLDRVPPGRLRRRFPGGCRANVYRGTKVGWVQAVVHSLADANIDSSAAPLLPLGPRSPGGDDDAQGEGSNASRYWFNVPIIEEPIRSGMKGKVDPEWVPSYLVRLMGHGPDDPSSQLSPRSFASECSGSHPSLFSL
jgi:hypothetical protein